MGNALSGPAPPLVEVSGPGSRILVPAGSSFPFFAPQDRRRERSSFDRPRRARRVSHSPPYSDSEVGSELDFARMGGGRMHRGRRPVQSPPFSLRVDPDRLRMRGRRKGGFRGMPAMGGLDPGELGLEPEHEYGYRPFDSAPTMGPQFEYHGMGARPMGIPRAGVGGRVGAGVPGMGIGGAAGMGALGMGLSGPERGVPPDANAFGLANPYAPVQVPAAPVFAPQAQPGIAMQPRAVPVGGGLPKQVPTQMRQRLRRRASAPEPDFIPQTIIDGAHQAELPGPGARRVPGGPRPQKGGYGSGEGNEWVQTDDPFLDACVCPPGCECRTGRRARYRMRLDDGRAMGGTIRYEKGYQNGEPCKNGCKGHSAPAAARRKENSDAEQECAAARKESRDGLKRLSKKFNDRFNDLTTMLHDMAMGNQGIPAQDDPMMSGGRMAAPLRMASDPLMGTRGQMNADPMMQGMMGSRMPGGRSMSDPRMGGMGDPRMGGMPPINDSRMHAMPAMGMDQGFPGGDSLDGFGMGPDMDDVNPMMDPMMGGGRPPMNFPGGPGGRRRWRGGRKGGGAGRGKRAGERRRRPTFEEDDFEMGMSMGLGGRHGGMGDEFDGGGFGEEGEWEDTEGDEYGDDLRGGSPPGRRRGGARPGMGRHMSGRGMAENGRRARVEDDDEGEV